MSLRLAIDLVPLRSAGHSLAVELPQSLWQRISKAVRDQAGFRCQTCGAANGQPYQLDCHEEWIYDDDEHIQRLVGFTALCKLCHYVRHMRSIASSGDDLPDRRHVIDHFCRVNGCDEAAFFAAKAAASVLYRQRSAHNWKIVTNDYLREYWFGQGWGTWSEALVGVDHRRRLRAARLMLAAIENETLNVVRRDDALLQELLAFDDLLKLDPDDPAVISDVAFNRLSLDDGGWDEGDYDVDADFGEGGYFAEIMSRD